MFAADDFEFISRRVRGLRMQCAVKQGFVVADCWCYRMAIDPKTGNYTDAHLPCPSAPVYNGPPTFDQEVAANVQARNKPIWGQE